MKKINFLQIFFVTAFFIAGFTNVFSQTSQIVNLTTGVNGAGSQLPLSSIDPKWTVKWPSGSSFQNCFATTNSIWTSNLNSLSCGRTIAPENYNQSPTPNNAPQGLFQYRMSFTKNSPCNVKSAKIIFNYTCADNEIPYFKVNNSFVFNYPVSTYPMNPMNPPSQYYPGIASGNMNPNFSYVVNLSPVDIINGTNNIDFYVQNYNASGNTPTPTGLALCAYLEIQYEGPLTSSISGPSSFCFGNPITLIGSTGVGTTANTHQWTLVECDATGSTIYPATFWVSPVLTGNPGSYTFPYSIPSLLCGKYYRIQLTTTNACYSHTSTKIIEVKCQPSIRFVRSHSICKGSCTTLWGGFSSSLNYSWIQLGGDEPIYLGNTSNIVVCPQVTTSYALTVTDPATGCNKVYMVTVTVEEANPNFSTSVSTINSGFITIAATPNQISGLPSSFGYAWTLYELDASNNTVFSVGNPSCWWNFPSTPTNIFNGFGGLTQAFDPTGTTPAVGQFKYNTPYRIERGVWSDACPYTVAQQTVFYGPRGLTLINETDNNKDETFAQIQREMKFNSENSFGNLSFVPNPTKGIITIKHLLKDGSQGKVVITDITGRIILEETITSESSAKSIDISKNENGVYFANFYQGNKLKKTEKVVLSK
jgi:hypothetical protein